MIDLCTIQQIYPDQYLRQLQTQEYYVATIKKKDTSAVMKALHAFPISEYLKRVKPLKEEQNNLVLLTKKSQLAKIEAIKQNLGNLIIKLDTIPLPNSPCPLKQKLVTWESYWPCSYKNDLEIINHSNKQLEFISKILKQQQFSIHIFSRQLETLFKFKGGCKQNTVLHGVILLLEQWPLSQAFNKEMQPPKNIPKLEQLQFQSLSRYYYLTGLSMLIKGSICQMCSMALVHSRLERLYYTGGDIQKVKNICYQKNLNHNYLLFRVTQ